MTLIDVNAAVITGQDKIARLDLAKTYDRVIREILLEGCRKVWDSCSTSMLRACLQPIEVETKS